LSALGDLEQDERKAGLKEKNLANNISDTAVPNQSGSQWQTDGGSRWSRAPEPAVAVAKFFTGDAIHPTIITEIEQMQLSFDGWAYMFDDKKVATGLVEAMKSRQVKGRLIFDKTNFLHSACSRQCSRMVELFAGGCSMRMLRPNRKAKGGLQVMHVKCWVFDAKYVLTGSVNMTQHGMHCNKEHLYRLAVPEFGQEVMEDFETDWERAEKVTSDTIDLMMRYKEDKEKKAAEKAAKNKEIKMQKKAAKGNAKPHGAVRHLTKEFEDVDETDDTSDAAQSK
jgi:phosphatidylserine/phosphatidylglycerophosphate/cardiolipin synthase-like enzyme